MQLNEPEENVEFLTNLYDEVANLNTKEVEKKAKVLMLIDELIELLDE